MLYLAGFDVRGEDPTAGGAFVVCAVFAVAAAGMWRVKYWAVIGFEVLLGVLLVSASLSLMLASNLQRRAAVARGDRGRRVRCSGS